MSRNLLRTDCKFCTGDVHLTSDARGASREDIPLVYFEEYAGMIVADASCVDCAASYLAWVTDPPSMRLFGRTKCGRGFIDLSFRSTFNDEPGDSDLPKYEIQLLRIRKPILRNGWVSE